MMVDYDGGGMELVIDFYTKPNCLLCDDALVTLQLLQKMYSFQINICNIHERDDWLEKYFLHIPVVAFDDMIITGEEIGFERLEKEINRKIKE